MKFINQIEIKYFRSFSDKAVKIEEVKDLNVFSWWNDSWKSNILRALNLFFNDEISQWVEFNFERDFSKFQLENSINKYNEKKAKKRDKWVRKKDQFIEIKIHFDLTEKPYWTLLPKKFWISKKWTRTKNAEINENVKTVFKKENQEMLSKLTEWTTPYANIFNSLKKSITTFQNKIEFFYVPAIKDYKFFKELYALLQKRMNEESGAKIEESKQKLQETIKQETENFFGKFKVSTGLNAGFLIEHELLDFRRNIEVDTDRNILLTSRWDGIQARLIPDILDELSDKSKYVLWWFEEPENSYEYRHSRKLADEFYRKYSINRQIFLTTHSKEFLWIRDNNLTKKSRLSIYRVFKDVKNHSKIEKYTEWNWFKKENILQSFLSWSQENTLSEENKGILERIYDDLGIIDEARLVSELEGKIESLNLEKSQLEVFKITALKDLQEIENMQRERDLLRKQLQDVPPQNTVIYCENQNAEHFNNLNIPNIVFLPSNSKLYAFDAAKTQGSQVYSLIDRDFLTDEEKTHIESNTNVRLLDYYCFENYLYHPDNLKEYFDSKNQAFDMILYTQNIINEFIEKFKIVEIGNGRMSYKSITEFAKSVYDSNILNNINKSQDFNEIYKYFSMKTYCTGLTERQNLDKTELAKTTWFKTKICEHITSMWITV